MSCILPIKLTSSTILFMTALTALGSTVLNQSLASTLLPSKRERSCDTTCTYLNNNIKCKWTVHSAQLGIYNKAALNYTQDYLTSV